MRTAIKHPVPDRVEPVICNFRHPATMTLTTERHIARMSELQISQVFTVGAMTSKTPTTQ